MKDSTQIPGSAVNIPVPNSLFTAMDYDGDAQYIAIYWTPAGDDAMVTDGLSSFTSNWQAYLAYLDHPTVRSGLARANIDRWAFGSSESEATHWLVLDREEHKAYVVPSAEADRFLWQQHNLAPTIPIEMTMETIMQAIAEAATQARMPTTEDLDELLSESVEKVRKLKEDLDLVWLQQQNGVLQP